MAGGVERILKARIPGCVKVEKANTQDDKNGTDYWAIRKGLPALSVDVKVRTEDWLAKANQDDLALETWSVVDRTPGWTRNQNKRTDYILWYWQDTSRFVLVPFPPLCKAFQSYWREWSGKYKTRKQRTEEGWYSECVFVPRVLVIEKITAWMGGTLTASTAQ